MSSELVQQFEALWESSDSSPDVFAFIEQHSLTTANEMLAVLLTDQSHRWQTDHPLKVEEYLSKLPELSCDSDFKLQLAVGEFQARQNGDTAPGIDEFTSRFSDISDALRSQLSELVSGDDEEHEFREATQTYISDSTLGDQQIGRYRLVRVLGEGAFGRVYLAIDDELQRQVAIKVPTAERLQKPEDAELYLEEARKVASLDHPNIVPVYDTGRTDDGSIYVVSKFIEGCTLEDRIKKARLGFDESAQLLATVAHALHHAHEKRLIHRDIKPCNILIEDISGTPYVADFGLAIREDDYLKDGRIAGTPAYMSPEQARGEGHRLDGRSDIFSLGVVLYQLLASKRPFQGSTANALLHQIISVEPKRPREFLDLQPAPLELERICLKALSKRASDRYATGLELADDLLHWNDQPEQELKELTIVPKGLRSFDADDADFFLDLLPGPRNRNGLPESIQFWKTRIEETDPDKTFSVGLIYGPSGCGKSSLMKAGLLPRLSEDVIAVYVEATPDETEIRVLRGLRKQLPELPQDLGLVETFTLLRRGEGRKVVIILDQFEQWLHAHSAEQGTELVSALRQCDGGTLQTVVMVRDDFWMAAERVSSELDIDFQTNVNSLGVDLFSEEHACKVLSAFGRAYRRFPDGINVEQEEFINMAVGGLAQDGRVVSVRLSLFADMMREKPWTPHTLRELGGTEGVGVTFLEETFSSRTAPPKHRFHQKAARAVLKDLLPDSGTDIKGYMRSYAELLEDSGYGNRPKDFDDLIRILDSEIRLITPIDPDGKDADDDSVIQTQSGQKYFQLTHDYLVPSLREWLTWKQKETRRGRAELKLAAQVSLWVRTGKRTDLPSLSGLLEFMCFTNPKTRSPSEQKMIRAAGEGIIACWLLLVMLLIPGWFLIEDAGNRERERMQSRIEGLAPTYADALEKMGHATISASSPADDPNYLKMIDQQIVWLELNLAIADIYTFRKHPDGNELIVDSETDYDRNHRIEGAREQRTPIGAIWEENDSELEDAYQGKASFDGIPHTDRWGTFVSSYNPMYDEDGHVEAVLGVDFFAEDWVSAAARARMAPLGILAIIFVVALPSVVPIYRAIANILRIPTPRGKGVSFLKVTLVALCVTLCVTVPFLATARNIMRYDFLGFSVIMAAPIMLASLVYVRRA